MLMAPPSATKFLRAGGTSSSASVRAAIAGIHAPGSTYFASPPGTLSAAAAAAAPGIHDGTGRRLAGVASMAGIRARAGKVDRRVGLLFGIFLLLLVVALGRALYLGTVKASALRTAAFTQQIDVQPVPAQRGLITDSAGTPLALSQATDDLIADPYLIIRAGRRRPDGRQDRAAAAPVAAAGAQRADQGRHRVFADRQGADAEHSPARSWR